MSTKALTLDYKAPNSDFWMPIETLFSSGPEEYKIPRLSYNHYTQVSVPRDCSLEIVLNTITPKPQVHKYKMTISKGRYTPRQLCLQFVVGTNGMIKLCYKPLSATFHSRSCIISLKAMYDGDSIAIHEGLPEVFGFSSHSLEQNDSGFMHYVK